MGSYELENNSSFYKEAISGKFGKNSTIGGDVKGLKIRKRIC
jgi:hypothetical protein